MEVYGRHLLQTHRESIVQDLDFNHIVDHLLSSKLFNADEFRHITSLSNREDRVKALLDILMTARFEAYHAFVESLSVEYDWLSKLLEIKKDIVPADLSVDHFEDCLSRGNVPRLPIHYVRRTVLETQIQLNLTELRSHNMMVLLGVPGSGKSSLAISALRNDQSVVLNNCNGRIFWVNVGNCSSDEQIVLMQSRIFRKILSTFKFLNINYSEESKSLQGYTWQQYRDLLRDVFDNDCLKGALLVIDDLRCKRAMEAFNIGCKTMTTTQDRTLVNDFQPIFVEISGNLTQNESLEVIASYIDHDLKKLPSQAAKIHRICKGAPLLIAMVSGVLAENSDILKHNNSHWNHYIKQLKNKDTFFCHFWKHPDDYNPYSAIEMCINSSGNKESVDSYRLLAVLPYNVQVTTDALRVILNMTIARFESVIKLWKNKSLVIEHYNKDLMAYQYEIQDLIMSYLKTNTDKNTMSKMHVDLIQRYKKGCFQENLAYLPDDGYIAYFISYHIENTQNMESMWDLYSTLYNNLIFIGCKIRLSGPANVLKELEVYLEKTTTVGVKKTFIENLIRFVQKHGHDLYHYPDTDIVQNILQCETESILYYKAYEIMQQNENKDNLYLQFQVDEDVEDVNFIRVEVPDEDICVIRFLSNNIFVGNAKGNVGVWNEDLSQKWKKFRGTPSPIQSIELSKRRPYKMATTNVDGVVKIWQIDDCFQEKDSAENEGRSPTLSNSSYSLLTITHSSGPCKAASWGHNSDIFLVHTNPGGTVALYDLNGKQIMENIMSFEITITHSILSGDDRHMIIGFESWRKEEFGVYVYNIDPFEQIMTFSQQCPLVYLGILPHQPDSIIVLTTKRLYKWKDLKSTEEQDNESGQVIEASFSEGSTNEYAFHAACVSEDRLCIFISTTDCRILVYNLQSCVLIKEWNNYRGVVSCMDTFPYNDEFMYTHILITVTRDIAQSIKLWCVKSYEIAAASSAYRKAKLSMKFDCIFNKDFAYPHEVYEIQSALRRRSTTLHLSRVKRGSPDLSTRRSMTMSSNRKYSLNSKLKKESQISDLISKRSSSEMILHNSSLIAAQDKNNKIQIFFGKKLIAETSEAENAITSVAISPCGQYLVYSQDNGIITKFVWKLNQTVTMINLNDPIYKLEFINSMTLTVFGKQNALTVVVILENECHIKTILPCENTPTSDNDDRDVDSIDNAELSKPSMSPSSRALQKDKSIDSEKPTSGENDLIKCFFIQENSLILSVTRDGYVKLWTPSQFIADLILPNRDGSKISCASLQNSKLLVLCYCSGNFQIYNLVGNNEDVPLSTHLFDSCEKLDTCITSCCISYDCKILALGQESGDIVIWHITARSLVSVLNFDKTPVTDLIFSPAPPVTIETNTESQQSRLSLLSGPGTSSKDSGQKSKNNNTLILVSLAGQIAWWDVTYILAAKKSLKRISSTLKSLTSMPVSSPSDKLSLAEFDQLVSFTDIQNKNLSTVDTTNWENLWKGKKYRNYSPRNELLACIKLSGDRANKLMVDSMFEKFVTIDNSGTVYIMNVFDRKRDEIRERIYTNSLQEDPNLKWS